MEFRTGVIEQRWRGPLTILRSQGCLVGSLLLLLCAGALVGGLALLRSALIGVSDREAPFRRLSEGLTSQQRAAGMVHAGGTVQLGTTADPLCLVEHQHYVSGKNGGWRTDATAITGLDVRLRTADGSTPRLEGVVQPRQLRFSPASPRVVEGELESTFRAQTSFPFGGRIIADCARDGDTIFVEGCRYGLDSIGPCERLPLTVTWGQSTPQRRIDDAANGIAGRLSAGFLALLFLLVATWSAIAARPQVRSLVEWAGSSKRANTGLVVALYVIAAVTALVIAGVRNASGRRGSPEEVGAMGHWFAFAVAGLFALVTFIVLRRRRDLRAAARVMDDTKTSKLAESHGGRVELAVRIAPDAVTAVGPLTKKPWALLSLSVKAVVQRGKNQAVEQVLKHTTPALLPIHDASGVGKLRTEYTDLDLPAQLVRCSANTYIDEYEPRIRALVGNGCTVYNASAYLIEESYAPAGAELYVYGEVNRVTPNSAGASDYRSAGVEPEVGGNETTRLVVHAGTERSLRELLRSELQFTTGLALTSSAMGLALLVVDAWLLSR